LINIKQTKQVCSQLQATLGKLTQENLDMHMFVQVFIKNFLPK